MTPEKFREIPLEGAVAIVSILIGQMSIFSIAVFGIRKLKKE